jgi:plastocyanin
VPAVGTTIATGPGGASYGYLTPAMVTQVGGPVNYTNGDIARHDVVSSEPGLFRSALASTGQTVPVEGLENVESGKTYEFFCSLHPNMKGQLIVR